MWEEKNNRYITIHDIHSDHLCRSNRETKHDVRYNTYHLEYDKKPAGFELIMHMYYAFDNHIYLFSSMTPYVFLVWQIYYSFLIYAFNFLTLRTDDK